MSIVRAIDANGDWLFGKGQNDYKRRVDALVQNIQTRCLSFLGDCFFSLTSGINWFNLLGPGQELNLQLALSATILNTDPNITGILVLTVNLGANRDFTITYKVQTTYGPVGDTFQYSLAS